jgi:hypothetical protein
LTLCVASYCLECQVTQSNVSESENAAFHHSAVQPAATRPTHIYLRHRCKVSPASGKITGRVERSASAVHCYSRISAANARRRQKETRELRRCRALPLAPQAGLHIPPHGRRLSMDYKLPTERELWPVRERGRRLLVRPYDLRRHFRGSVLGARQREAEGCAKMCVRIPPVFKGEERHSITKSRFINPSEKLK